MRLCLLLLVIFCARSAAGHALQPVVMTVTEQAAHRFRIETRAPGSAPPDEEVRLAWPAHCRVSGTQLHCAPPGLRGATLHIDKTRELAGQTEARELFVVIRFLDGSVESGVLRGARDRFELTPLPPKEGGPSGPAWGTLRRFAGLGMRHVLGGADHVLFVLALLFVVARARPLFFALSAFTLAHSVTLALSTLGWVRPDPRWVEALIALSVLLLAREVLRTLPARTAPPALPGLRRGTWTARHPMALSFACGLLHGLGFASALAEIGLPAGQSALALFAFNLGVEFGQLGLVLMALGPLRWVGRARIVRTAAYLIGGLAAAWTIERIAALFTQ